MLHGLASRCLPAALSFLSATVLLVSGSVPQAGAGPSALSGRWSIHIPLPTARSEHTTVLETDDGRMVLFGGQDGAACNDVWVLAPGDARWTELEATGTPPPARYAHTGIYDSQEDRMIVFGGRDGVTLFNDVWALSLGPSPAWTQLAPLGGTPAPRRGHVAVYDPVRDRMVVFGGHDGTSYRKDVWALALGATPSWSQLSPSGGPTLGRYENSAVYDSARDRMIVFGGLDSSRRNDVFALPLAPGSNWVNLVPAGSPPAARDGHVAIFDPDGDRMIVFGGRTTARTNDTWALSLSGTPTWSELTPAGDPPSARVQHAAVLDPAGGGMIVFGGDEIGLCNDLLELALEGPESWSSHPANAPTERVGHAAVYDPLRQRVLMFGGEDDSYLNECWSLSSGSNPHWTRLEPAGTPPPARAWHTLVYDPARDRLVIFGGQSSGHAYLGDVWTLELSGTPAWVELTPGGAPPTPRMGQVAIFDPDGDRMILFGGFDGAFEGDLWELTFAAGPSWNALSPAGSAPAGRVWSSAVYDEPRRRMIVFGGLDGALTRHSDVWALELDGAPAWTELLPAGPGPLAIPPERDSHSALYDPSRDRMVVFGGVGSAFFSDAWELALGGSPTWSELTPIGDAPPPRSFHIGAYDPTDDRMIIFGGDGDGGNLTWALDWGITTGVSPLGAGFSIVRAAIAGTAPNPFASGTRVDFVLTHREAARLEVFDVTGRRVRVLAAGVFDPGTHARGWDGCDEDGRRRAPGTYFARLTAGGEASTIKLILLPR